MAAQRQPKEIEAIHDLSYPEALRLFQDRGGGVPESCSRATIWVVRSDALGPDLQRGSWLLEAPPPRDGEDHGQDFTGDLCIMELDCGASRRCWRLMVRRVWWERGDNFRILHPTIDWAPGDRGQAPGEVLHRNRIGAAWPVHGVLAFDVLSSSFGLRRRSIYTPGSHWRGVAGRITPAIA